MNFSENFANYTKFRLLALIFFNSWIIIRIKSRIQIRIQGTHFMQIHANPDSQHIACKYAYYYVLRAGKNKTSWYSGGLGR
jgi:hypothetical protein